MLAVQASPPFSFTLIKRLFNFSLLSAIRVVSSVCLLAPHYWAGENSWKQCGPEALELKGEWAELIIPEQSQYWVWSVLVLQKGRGINS